MTAQPTFPTARINEITSSPQDFMLMERIPLTREDAVFPMALNEPVGDERQLLLLDTETCGLNPETDPLIELGMVMITYSPSMMRITSIEKAASWLEDPDCEIPEDSIKVHGITQEDVAGHSIEDERLSEWMSKDTLVVAHNAGFDRPVIEQRFVRNDGPMSEVIESMPWGCTNKEIDWRGLGYEGTKLEYLLLKEGYFYAGHRAEVDCLAMAWLLYLRPDAFEQLLTNARKVTKVVRAIGAPFGVKDDLKGAGFRWHGDDIGVGKHWWSEVSKEELEERLEFMVSLYPFAREKALIETHTARTRFKAS